jgi:hypothetical protein
MEQICGLLVIPSGVESSLCELSAESKDPYRAGTREPIAVLDSENIFASANIPLRSG